ncbi:RNA-binding protein 14a [Eucyclogobius newberryi]|uniref:RNA-binding protein 14a n=1 Tax=Eucyclogobius newberryi TaxID=166745 RepID=UPI003B58D563
MSETNIKLFVGNLPADATEDELTKLFSPFGEINTCSLLRQYAFVTLRGEGAADRAIRSLDGKEYRGRPLVVEESRARPPNSIKVFVGNLSATCSADDLHTLFSSYGKVLDCDKVKARLCSNVGYAFVHMERRDEALTAIEGLNGSLYKGRQLAVELSKAQPLANQMSSADGSGREGLLPRPALEHHQSQAAVLAAAAAAAAGLPIQVQQSVHNSFYNTTPLDPTYTALRGITSSKGADGVIYGALASQVYGSVADKVYKQPEVPATPDPTTLFEAARAKFFQDGQKVLAEQQAGSKGPPEAERDRSPIRGNRAPLLPDPVPGSFGSNRTKRRALLPTPPGAPEDSVSTTAAAAPEGADPVARSYTEYCQQMQQYQQYQQYQQQYQYLQYAYTNPPPPPSAPAPSSTQAPPSTAAQAPPGSYSAPQSYAYPPPGMYNASGGYNSAAGHYDAASSGTYSAAPAGSYDTSAGYTTGAYGSTGAYPTTPYEQTPAHGQPTAQRNDYPYHTPEPPYR